MPLRPVSELGLVDLTDLTPRDATEPTRAEKPEAKQHGVARTRPATRQKTRATAARRAAKSGRAPAKTSTAAVRAKTTDSAARSAKRAAKQTPRSTTVAGVATAERATARVMTPAVTKVGLPLLSGIAAVAGGLVVARAALQR